MRSTMQETPLSIATLVRYGTTVHGSAEVVTWTGDGARSATYAEVGRARRPAGPRPARARRDRRRAGRHLHVEQPGAPRGLPRGAGMGAVLHTAEHPAVPRAARLHRQPRRGPGRHRRRLAAAAAGQGARRSCRTVEHVVVNGAGRPVGRSRAPAADACTRYEELLAGQPDDVRLGRACDERDAAAMCYTSGTTGNPKGVVYSHRSIYLHSMQVCMADGVRRSAPARPGAARRADVPRHRLGHCRTRR